MTSRKLGYKAPRPCKQRQEIMPTHNHEIQLHDSTTLYIKLGNSADKTSMKFGYKLQQPCKQRQEIMLTHNHEIRLHDSMNMYVKIGNNADMK